MTEELKNFLASCEKVHDELTVMASLEQDKRKHLLSYDIKKIEEVAKKQQALIMKLENAERKRITCQELAGFKDKSASDILPLLEKEDKEVFKEVFNKLNLTADGLKISNKASLDIVAIELNMLKDKLPRNANQIGSSIGKKGYTTYSKSTFQGTY